MDCAHGVLLLLSFELANGGGACHGTSCAMTPKSAGDTYHEQQQLECRQSYDDFMNWYNECEIIVLEH